MYYINLVNDTHSQVMTSSHIISSLLLSVKLKVKVFDLSIEHGRPAGFFFRGGQIRDLGTKVPQQSPKTMTDCENNA